MIINAKTKRGQDWINRTNHRDGYSLDDVYVCASHAKHQAYRWCLERYRKDEHAKNFRITSHTHQNFTVAWDTLMVDNSTGEALPCRHIETSRHTYDIVG